jgi:sulfopyruvate decarboxylase TPP-binding subunit
VSYRLADDGFFSIDFGQKNIEEGAIELNGKKMLFKEIGLGNLIIEDQSGTTAYHIPEGILLIFDPKDLSLKTEIVKIPSTQVTPGILSNYNVEIPSYMAYSKTPGLS